MIACSTIIFFCRNCRFSVPSTAPKVIQGRIVAGIYIRLCPFISSLSSAITHGTICSTHHREQNIAYIDFMASHTTTTPSPGIPHVVHVCTAVRNFCCTDTDTESCWDDLETSVEESRLQADWAARQAWQMQECVRWWDERMPKQKANKMLDGTTMTDKFAPVKRHDTADSALRGLSFLRNPPTYGCESRAPMTPPLKKARQSVPTDNDLILPSLIAVSPCTSETSPNNTISQDRVVHWTRHDGALYHQRISVSSSDDTTLSSETCLGEKVTVEDFHRQVQDQTKLVDEVCRRTKTLQECVAVLQRTFDMEKLCDRAVVVLPDLTFWDRIYLDIALFTTRLLDYAYVIFCSCLSRQGLRDWAWIYEHMPRRARNYTLGLLVLLLFLFFVRNPLISAPPSGRFILPPEIIHATIPARWEDTHASELAEFLL